MSFNTPPNSDTEDDSRESPSKWSRNPLQLNLIGVGGVGKRKSAFLPYRPQIATPTIATTITSATTATTVISTIQEAQNASASSGTSAAATSATPAKSTVLTNLQRGNTAATFFSSDVQLSFHERAGQGELTDEQVKVAATSAKTIDTSDKHGFTALHWACYYGQVATVAQLLATGAVDVNKLAPDMVSPLLLAAAGGHHEIVRLLLQHGANARHADIVGNTALMYAAAGNHPHTCNELLSQDPDLTATNEHGDTAYNLAMDNCANLSQAVLEHYLTALLSI